MRIKTSKRAEQRKEKREREDIKKREMKEDINKMKSVKKEEIAQKLREAKEISGSSAVLRKIEKELGTTFNADDYDRRMEHAFGDKYYEEADKDKVMSDVSDQEEEEDEQGKEEMREQVPKPQETNDIWWSCDGCLKPIKPGKYRFDC